ncbi:hypothetical protein EWI07_11020 [Sporolactobacillus sp. THM7-4]|nr:hypothetical protein EWI07_11020 [Sporolactobacillus sp. THM7-4]
MNTLKLFWEWMTCKNMNLIQAQIQLAIYFVNLVLGSFCIFFDANNMWSSDFGNLASDVPLFIIWLIIFLKAYDNVTKNKRWWNH